MTAETEAKNIITWQLESTHPELAEPPQNRFTRSG